MIRHVVILDLEKNAPKKLIKEKILNLKNEIKEIINIEVGIDIKFDPASSDICIIADFKDKKDLEIYANHPKHIEIIEKYIKPYLILRKVTDFEKK